MRSRVWVMLLLCYWPWLSLASEPVDTTQFGNIKNGMLEAEVVRRLGEPEKIYEEPSTFIKVPTPRGVEIRERRRSSYFYPGNSQIMDALITFEGGRVVDKVKIAR